MSGDAGGSHRPTIGVIMSARDASDTIAQSLTSLFAQTVVPDRVVVVDDGSSDATADIVEALARTHDELVLVRSAHIGRAAARNLAIQALSTDLIAVQDADDIALPWRFEEALATFESHPDAVAVGAQMLGFCRPGYAWSMPRWPVDAGHINEVFEAGLMGIAHPTAVMRRDAVLAAGGYDERFAYGEDLTLMALMSTHGSMASSGRDVTLYRKPRRHSFAHLIKTERATRRAHLLRADASTHAAAPRLSLGSSLGAVASVTRVWLRQRIKPMPRERPLREFGVDASVGTAS